MTALKWAVDFALGIICSVNIPNGVLWSVNESYNVINDCAPCQNCAICLSYTCTFYVTLCLLICFAFVCICMPLFQSQRGNASIQRWELVSDVSFLNV